MQEAKYTATLKGATMNDSWLIIKTDTAEDMVEALDLAYAWDLPGRIARVDARMKQVSYE